jgi:hypothetical protein
LLTDALENFAGNRPSTLNVALIVSVGLALWSEGGRVVADDGSEHGERHGRKAQFYCPTARRLGLDGGATILAIVALAAVALIPASAFCL